MSTGSWSRAAGVTALLLALAGPAPAQLPTPGVGGSTPLGNPGSSSGLASPPGVTTPRGSLGTLSPNAGTLNPNAGTLAPGGTFGGPAAGTLAPPGSDTRVTPPAGSTVGPRSETGSLGGGGLTLNPAPLTPRPNVPGSAFGTPGLGQDSTGQLPPPVPGSTATPGDSSGTNFTTPRPSVPGSSFGTTLPGTSSPGGFGTPGAGFGLRTPGTGLGSGSTVGR